MRSGSTLLYALLNQHSEIALSCEGDLPSLQHYLSLLGRLRSGAWRERWEFWNQGASRHGIAIESLPGSVSDVWEATRIVYQSIARRKQATFWGEKTHWHDCPVRIAEKFPDARFIFLWRDLHGVMDGIARAALTERFFRKPGLANRALLGNEKLRQAYDALKAQGRLMHELCYEDLTANTAECMRQICEFLEVPFEPQMISLRGSDRSAIAGSDREHHAMLWTDSVVAEEPQGDLVSPALQRKTDRYIRLWKERCAGKWPKYPVGLPESARPGFIEFWLDRIIYRSLLGWDEAVKVMYALAPLPVCRWFRSLLGPHALPVDCSRSHYESFGPTTVLEPAREQAKVPR